MKENLVYCCVFFNKDYLKLLDLLLKSMKIYSSLDSFDFLVITNPEFKPNIDELSLRLGLELNTYCLQFTTFFQAACARLFIFDYSKAKHYKKFLYLDTDILIKGDLAPLFELPIKELLYGIESGTIDSPSFGSQFFSNEKPKETPGINSGTLLFLNSTVIHGLFSRIRLHIETFTYEGNNPPYCMDQPFINFHAIKDSLYDNFLLNPYVSLYEGSDEVSNYETSLICHFSFPIGNFAHKHFRMINFFKKLLLEGRSELQLEVIGKRYCWNTGYIRFSSDALETSWGNGTFSFLDSRTIVASWNSFEHILRFNHDFSEYFSIRILPLDFEYISGSSGNIDDVMFKQYHWNSGNIVFDRGFLVTTWGRGTYEPLGKYEYKISWSGIDHTIRFNDDFTSFTSRVTGSDNISYHNINTSLKDSIPELSEYIEYSRKDSRKLIYFCVFHNPDYFKLLSLLLESLQKYSPLDSETDLLIFTSEDLLDHVEHLKSYGFELKVQTFSFKTMHEAGCARLHIFDFKEIDNYEKILYLDTDILVQGNLMRLFDCLEEDKLYATKEYDVYGAGHGGYFFDFRKIDKKQDSLNSGTLLFYNSAAIRRIFKDIHTHIRNLVGKNTLWPLCMDQPFLSYHFIKNSMCNLDSLFPLICLKGERPAELLESHCIIHFVWPIGNALHKLQRMLEYGLNSKV